MKRQYRFTVSDILLLVTLITVWMAVTLQLQTYSILFWGLAVVMAGVLRPSHQRNKTPESVTEVLSVAIIWAVACGLIGLLVDVRFPNHVAIGSLSWSVWGQLTGFYLGMVWVLVVLLARHVERITGLFGRTRTIS